VTIAAKPSRIACATTVEDLNGTWATDKTYAAGLLAWYARILAAGIISEPAPKPTGDTPVVTTPTVAFGNVPKFGYIDYQSRMATKPEGVGWDNLGKRDMLGIVLHRMWGTLNGTLNYFSDPTVGALTDFAVGVEAIDGKANAGVIQQYNDPFGYRSGWASGRVSAPYGDGLLFVQKYGVNAVNKRLTSLEISGFENTPIDDFAWGEIVHFVAYWADQCHISWEQFPINPATGISFLFWHQEMTFGTGKLCPWQVVMSRTNELIEDVKVVLKAAQTSGVVTPPVEIPPIVIPAPTYAAAVPITELAMMADRDFAGSKPYRDVTLANGKKLRARVVLDKVKVTNPSSFYQQYAIEGGKRTKPDPKVDDLVDVVFSITSDAGEEYWIDPQWARISQDKALLAED